MLELALLSHRDYVFLFFEARQFEPQFGMCFSVGFKTGVTGDGTGLFMPGLSMPGLFMPSLFMQRLFMDFRFDLVHAECMQMHFKHDGMFFFVT